ncbi:MULTISPECIES: tripartite tricarboxylate transporter substrate binding protein [Cupriavidus]|jgi:tripartite-type tricarboxylate transporter receptor subunit TctC|uniref:Tripartite tricarboxylate transporter substrate binding protein n=1 Tax=Cupriavidus metallidurans TaxID=119219 RepID=A0A482IP32_9BURK|nr:MULTISPECIES: tripartite tricarboxylate transporter substrate binding protein [Cupriavidus]KWR78308.1 MFS transporter [Cupriavidus sp. SHE]QBP09696.1 tripartite tricarboxylate transporter substrate binding protein [Cupriavidus metallidurans]QWC90047.1 tripartite tricarboxylate transporter substrate binding protein [Cupriavidus metallidurans]
MTAQKDSRRAARRRLVQAAILASGLMLAVPAMAQSASTQNWPSRPVRVVVPYPPGGVSDAVTRLVMQKLAERIGQPVVVENRPGANGMIGSDNVAKSAPDGYSLLVVVAAHAINPSLYQKMSYDPIRDLTGVSEIGRIPLLMVSSAQLPPKSVKELVSWGKAHPDQMTFASSGSGSGAHLAGELFSQGTGMTMTHVPYKGISPALPDLISGQVAVIFDSVQTMIPLAKAGKVRALAITNPRRWPAAPDVPTMAEAGYPNIMPSSWIGVLAPAKTPTAIVDRLSAELDAVVHAPDVQAKLIDYGIDPVGGKADQFQAFIKEEAGRWASVVQKAGIKLD